jgi:hypothetical protein
MRHYIRSLLIVSVVVAGASCNRTDSCTVQPAEYSGQLSAAFPLGADSSGVSVAASRKSVGITFSADPAIGIESAPESCKGDTLRGRFEDNWGNTGIYVLDLGGQPTLEFFELGTPEEMAGRNTIGAYPENAVPLVRAK